MGKNCESLPPGAANRVGSLLGLLRNQWVLVELWSQLWFGNKDPQQVVRRREARHKMAKYRIKLS